MDTLCKFPDDKINEYNSELDTLIKCQLEIILNDSLIANDDSLSENDINGLLDKNISLKAVIQSKKEIVRGFMEDVFSGIANSAEDLIDQNDTITPNNLVEENEVTINGIYLKTVAKGIIPDSALYATTLFEIASQCPFVGGPAVYHARSLLKLINREIFFDDSRKCSSPDTCFVPPMPGLINVDQNTGICKLEKEFQVNEVQGASSYEWTIGGEKDEETTSTLQYQFYEFGGQLICVSAINSCGSSPQRCLLVTGYPSKIDISDISGNTNVCNEDIEVYTWLEVPGATSYTIINPDGSTLLTAMPTTDLSATIEWGESGGDIMFIAQNDCGNSDTTYLAVSNTCRKSTANHLMKQFGDVRVIPNPSTGLVTFISNVEIRDGRIDLVNSMGQFIRTVKVQNSTIVSDIDLSEYNNGTIEFRVFDKEELISRGILIIIH